MSIALGGIVINKLALGGTLLLKAYHGADLIHDKTNAPAEADVILLENGADTLLLESGPAVELDVTIPSRSSASTLDGSEWLVVAQGGTTKKVRASLLAGYLNG
jgi:hypothetical protein